jgi:hypothetical protein
MSTIAYSNPEIAARSVPAQAAKSFWAKLYERMVAAQQLRAERSVANYLASHGGLITDDMEREIMARLSVNGSLRRSR